MKIPKRISELPEKLASELSASWKTIVDKVYTSKAVISFVEEINKLISYKTLKNTPLTEVEWYISFTVVLQEYMIIHESKTRISSVILGNASKAQYSLDDGTTWNDFSTSFTTQATHSRWRVPNFGATGKGAIIIKGIKL